MDVVLHSRVPDLEFKDYALTSQRIQFLNREFITDADDKPHITVV